MPANGIHPLSREEYDRLDRVNWSRLKVMAKSPAHYRHALTVPREDTPSLRLGRATHMAILEPKRFEVEWVQWDGGVRRGREWDEFCALYGADSILKPDEYDRCLAIGKAVRESDAAMRYLAGGMAEVTATWTHREPAMGAVPGFAIDCKGRVDFVSDAGAVVDLKTCRDASQDGFGRQAWALTYYGQLAWYRDGVSAATGRAPLPCKLIAVESEAPHVVSVFDVPEAVLDLGREHYRALLQRLVQCREENHWPGYVTGEVELTLPKWSGLGSAENELDEVGLIFGSDA